MPLGIAFNDRAETVDGIILDSQPFIYLREATREEFEADRGSPSGPEHGPYFYEFTTD